MNKLRELAKHLLGREICNSADLALYVVEATVLPCNKNPAHDATALCLIEYSGVIEIGRTAVELPHLAASIHNWLINNDPSRFDQALEHPQIVTTEVDDKRRGVVNLEIRVTFREQVEGVENTAGAYTVDGKTYAIDTPQPWPILEDGESVAFELTVEAEA